MKKVRNAFLALLVASVMLVPSYASDYTPGRSYDWSPYSSSYAGYGSSGGNRTITTYTNYYWDSNGAYLTNLAYEANSYHATMEHNIGDGVKLSADVNSIFSNYENPYFDCDDDTGDGYNEEAEAIFLGIVAPNKTYTMATTYTKAATAPSSGKFDTIYQRSLKLGREYQAFDFDLLETTPWSCPNSVSAAPPYSAQNTLQSHGNEDINEKGHQQITYNKFETKNGLKEYYANQLEIFADNEKSTYSSRALDNEMTTTTITFSHPISLREMLDLAEKVDGKVEIYHATFKGENSEKYTVGTREMDELALIDWATDCIDQSGDTMVAYNGIVSVELTIPATNETINKLYESPLVFGVDLSNYLYEHSDEYDPNVKIIVPHYAAEVESFCA